MRRISEHSRTYDLAIGIAVALITACLVAPAMSAMLSLVR